MVRKVADQLARPYVTEIVGHIDNVTPAPTGVDRMGGLPPELVESHAALHEARTLALCDAPAGAKTVLSAGANGRWYFDWVEEAYGPVTRHIGVEAYMPKPDDLPPNVEWIPEDLAGEGGIAAIESGSIDLVFSGQNIEHLWPRQMVALLIEANRVLRQDAWLVLDSPNRAITAELGWSMGEHTIELTPTEARDLLETAGFSVDHLKGVWLCRIEGTVLQLEPDPTARGPASVVRRLALARERPEDSFIWWAEARRTSAPDVPALSRAVERHFADSWAERVGRIKLLGGEPYPWVDGRDGALMRKGRDGYSIIGPYMPLPAGSFVAETDVMWSDCDDFSKPLARWEVVADDELVGWSDVDADGQAAGMVHARCPFELTSLRFAVHVRLLCTGAAAVRVPLGLSLSPEPWRSLL